MVELFNQERLQIERIKAELRANGMDDYEIEKYIADCGIQPNRSLQQDQMEFEFLSNEKLYVTRYPIEIDENELPVSINSDFTIRSRRRKRILDVERSPR